MQDQSPLFDVCLCPAAGQMLIVPLLSESDSGATVLVAEPTRVKLGQRVRAYYCGDPYDATVRSVEATDDGSRVSLMWASAPDEPSV